MAAVVVSALSILCMKSHADDSARTHDIVADDYFTLANIGTCKISPDADYVAYTESRWEKDLDGRNTDLWVVHCATKETRRLTFNQATEGSIRWSPNSRYIYFRSNQERAGEENPPYDGKQQVWRIPPTGGEPQAVTRV